jgi:PAS domain S-box-containing protein
LWKLRWDDEADQVLCLIKDLNEVKQLERKVQENKGRLKRTENLAKVGNWEYDLLNKISSASDEVYRIYGIDRSSFPQITPQVFSGLVHPDDLRKLRTNVAEIEESSVLNLEHRMIRPDGEIIYVIQTGTIKRDDTGRLTHLYGTVQDITERKILEKKLERELRSRQKQITDAVIKGQERERSHLSRELHDNINQMLTTVKLYSEMALEDKEKTGLFISKSMDIVQTCINEIRNISKQLSAPTLGKISFQESILELVQSINLANKVRIQCSLKDLEDYALPQELHLAIYRIIQEQLNNIIKYAEARSARIKVVNTSSYLKLCIQDDGKGFNIKAKRKGLGITNMISRAESVYGKLVIKSEEGKGCKLQVYFPSLETSRLVLPSSLGKGGFISRAD